jgi:hypothetical protein
MDARPRARDVVLSRRNLILFGITTIAVLGVPITVAFDSYLYVQSSRHVFGAGALEGYHWIREPLYPLIIKIIRAAAGNADIWLIWTQLGALVMAAHLASRAVLGQRSRWVLGTAIVASLNPMALGYAGAVLQTTWIMLALAANCALIAAAWRDPAPRAGRYMFTLIALTVLSAYLSFQLAYLSLATGFALGIRLLHASPTSPVVSVRDKLGRPALFWASLATGVAIGLGAVVIGVVSLQPWVAYKTAVTGGAETDEMGLSNTAGLSPTQKLASLVSDPAATAVGMTSRPLELLGLRTPLHEENPVFGFGPFSPEQRCGKLFWAETMPGPVEETRQLLQPTCKSRIVHGAIGLFARPGAWLYRASTIALIAAIPILLIARRWEALLLGPPVLLLLLYAAIDASNDRYGFPVYPIGVALLAAALRWGTRRVWGGRADPFHDSELAPNGSVLGSEPSDIVPAPDQVLGGSR